MTQIIIFFGWYWIALGALAGLGVVAAALLWIFPKRIKRLKEIEDRIFETGVKV